MCRVENELREQNLVASAIDLRWATTISQGKDTRGQSELPHQESAHEFGSVRFERRSAPSRVRFKSRVRLARQREKPENDASGVGEDLQSRSGAAGTRSQSTGIATTMPCHKPAAGILGT